MMNYTVNDSSTLSRYVGKSPQTFQNEIWPFQDDVIVDFEYLEVNNFFHNSFLIAGC